MFRKQLRRNLRLKLRSLGLNWRVEDSVGVFTVHVPESEAGRPIEPIVEHLRQVFGIAWLTAARRLRPCRWTPQSQAEDLRYLQTRIIELASAQYAPDQTFCVRVNRGNKFLPFASPQLAAQLGEAILDHTAWRKVNLTHPDITFHLDIRSAATFLFGAKLKGPGGLPVGTAGRVLGLFSGGIDSPAAVYLMARRGCRVDFIHFTANSIDETEARASKVWRLAQQLSHYTLRSRVYFVPYVHFDLALLRQPVNYELVLFRRFMVRVAEKLARQLKARALVSGDNLSQVASQTLSNLVSTSQAVRLPILRPLIGFDKEETIALARKIGTFDLSVEPYKDCCALISGHPKTRSHHEKLAELEARVFPDYETLIAKTLADAVVLDASIVTASDATESDESPTDSQPLT